MRVWVNSVAALSLAAGVCFTAVPAAQAQAHNAETLADIRQELSVLYVELQRLNRDLSTTGNPSVAVGGATALERMQRIEEELTRLTARTEEMSLRISSIVSDGTNRVGDLEFRLCELEPDCDIGSLGDTPSLGGDLPPNAVVTAPLTPAPGITPDPNASGGSELAMSEERDFEAARAALESGDYAQAVTLFQTFTQTYTGGPLNAEAHFLRGEALAAQGLMGDAGRAYLESFSGSPDGPIAPDALLQLGLTLDSLGQANEACVMLGQVGARFPGAPQASAATEQMRLLGCS